MKFSQIIIFAYLVISVINPVLGAGAATRVTNVPRYGIFEVSLTAAGTYSNPYLMMPGDSDTPGFVVGKFTGPGGVVIQIDGFWDGGKTWRIRMSPTVKGVWNYTTSSSDQELNGKSGSFVCVASKSKGFPKVDSKHPHHFVWSDGSHFYFAQACLIVSSYDERDAQGGHRRVDNGTFQNLVDIRADEGFSSVGCVSAFNKPQFNNGTQRNEGGPPFTGYDPRELNPFYHHYLDLRVTALTTQNIMVVFQLGAPDQDIMLKIGEASLKRYWRYLIARYAAYNVSWNLFGEIQEFGNNWLSLADDFGGLTRRWDPYHHLLTSHTAGDLDPEFCTRRWLDYIELQRPPDVTSAYLHYNKPVHNAEYGGYEGLFESTVGNPDGDSEKLRPKLWDVKMHGGYFTFESWTNNIDSQGARYAKWNNLFFKDSTNYWLLEYHPELFANRPGLANPGKEYVIYLPVGGSVTVDLSTTNRALYVEWYNPRNGMATRVAGSVPGGALRTFITPDLKDWVLHLTVRHKTI